MAPLPTIPNVFRVAFDWSPARGIKPVNVINVQSSSSDVQDIGGVILDAFDGSNAFNCMSLDSEVLGLNIIPLDGETATIYVPVDGQSITGGYSGEIAPAVAGLVSLRTGIRGPRGRGRLYIGPVAEGALTDGFLVEDARSAMQSAWITSDAEMIAASPAVRLGVASYVHSEWNQILSINVEQACATQRRRQDQLR